MKHAVIIDHPQNHHNHIAVKLSEEKTVYLAQAEYTPEETDLFNAQKDRWIMIRSGSMYFLADSDSGEDARGSYRGCFDLRPENAVFDEGRFIGIVLCPGNLRYSGLSRSSFDVDQWGYPGDDPFTFISAGNEVHLFLFDEQDTLSWKDWYLTVRDPEKKYNSYIDF